MHKNALVKNKSVPLKFMLSQVRDAVTWMCVACLWPFWLMMV